MCKLWSSTAEGMKLLIAAPLFTIGMLSFQAIWVIVSITAKQGGNRSLGFLVLLIGCILLPVWWSAVVGGLAAIVRRSTVTLNEAIGYGIQYAVPMFISMLIFGIIWALAAVLIELKMPDSLSRSLVELLVLAVLFPVALYSWLLIVTEGQRPLEATVKALGFFKRHFLGTFSIYIFFLVLSGMVFFIISIFFVIIVANLPSALVEYRQFVISISAMGFVACWALTTAGILVSYFIDKNGPTSPGASAAPVPG